MALCESRAPAGGGQASAGRRGGVAAERHQARPWKGCCHKHLLCHTEISPSIHPSIRPPIYVTVRPPLFILPFCWAQQLHWTWATSPTKRWLIVCLRREQQQRRGGFRGWTVKSRGDQPLHASLGKSDVKEDNRWSVYIHFWSGIPDLCIPVPVCTCPPVSQHASRPTTSLFPLVLVLLCLCSAAQLLSPRRRSDVWNLISRAVSEISEESIGID